MGNVFTDLWASLQIFYSNFNARFGRLFNAVVILALLAVVVYSFARAILAGRKGRRVLSPLETSQPDRALTDHAAESLAQAIRIPSVTGDRAKIKELGRFLRERYPNVADTMDCAVLPDGSMLLRWCSAQLSDQNPVLLAGHLDVVPGGDGWTVCEPFEGLRQDGRVYGRGAMDCKGLVIAMLEAAESLMQEGYAPKRDLYFAFGADEESGGKHGAKAIADTLEQQGLKFDLILDEGGTIQDMECDGRTYSAAVIGMAEKQQVEYRMTVTCPGGHTSQPRRTTAVGILSEAICRIESAQPHHRVIPLVRKRLDAAISMYPFGKRFVIANKPLFNLLVGLAFPINTNGTLLTPRIRQLWHESPPAKVNITLYGTCREDYEALCQNGAAFDAVVDALDWLQQEGILVNLNTTIVPTKVEGSFPAYNVLPSTVSARLNARLLPGDDPEKVLSDLQELLSDLPLEVELVHAGEESFITSDKQPMYRLLRDTIQERFLHLPCIPTLMPSDSDARHYSGLSDCVLRFAPIVTGAEGGGNTHMGDEFLAEDSLGIAVELYRNLMKKL